MSLFKLDKETQKIYDMFYEHKVPPDFIKLYKTKIIYSNIYNIVTRINPCNSYLYKDKFNLLLYPR